MLIKGIFRVQVVPELHQSVGCGIRAIRPLAERFYRYQNKLHQVIGQQHRLYIPGTLRPAGFETAFVNSVFIIMLLLHELLHLTVTGGA